MPEVAAVSKCGNKQRLGTLVAARLLQEVEGAKSKVVVQEFFHCARRSFSFGVHEVADAQDGHKDHWMKGGTHRLRVQMAPVQL
eukprot:4654514-Amphidinium_carterae.1